MGYGVAMPTRSYRHMSAEERETVSLGLAQGHSLREMARCWAVAQHGESRSGPQCDTGPTVSSLHGTHVRSRPEPVSRGDGGNSWILGCGSTCRTTWLRAARRSRLPAASDARILAT